MRFGMHRIALFLLVVLLAAGCSETGMMDANVDPVSVPGDVVTPVGGDDDDSAAGDDDDSAAGDDDDSAAGDDDDSSSGDDDDTGDDDDIGDDDDSADQPVDFDSDGFAEDEDCNDQAANINPSALEICDGVDNDCDGVLDPSDSFDAPTWYEDLDGDGYGVDASAQTSCSAPHGYSAYSGDCNDGDPSIHPGATEEDCTDPTDRNCDGSVGYADADGDGEAACEDCDDSNDAISSAGVETCDGEDNDCDGAVDEAGATGEQTWYLDADGDGYGRLSVTLVACDQPSAYVLDSTDCDDLNGFTWPLAPELCDEEDNDCDDDVDEGVETTYYTDLDGDGYGDELSPVLACSLPGGASVNDLDCNDDAPDQNPGAYELCDGEDNDCDTETDEEGAIGGVYVFSDLDGDGWGDSTTEAWSCDGLGADEVLQGGDCADDDEYNRPNGTEVCDGADNNCDELIDEDEEVLGAGSLCPAASCQEILDTRTVAPSDGSYWVDPNVTGLAFAVECDMSTAGGAWTLITYPDASSHLSGTMTALVVADTEGENPATGPFTTDTSGGHSYRYDFDFLPGFSEFRLVDYVVQANAANGYTTDMWPDSFQQSVWGSPTSGWVGDVSFGDADASGPATSLAAVWSGNVSCQACDYDWPDSGAIYPVSAASSFRIEWGENGGQHEGWRPWKGGSVALR